jgi:hypothetical protein
MEAFKGLSGLTPLGYRTGSTSGLGDTTLAAIARIYQGPVNQLNISAGLSLPTGSTTDDITLLLPSNTTPAKRGFYAMQPGTGTYFSARRAPDRLRLSRIRPGSFRASCANAAGWFPRGD